MTDPGFALYVHWPFCQSKCPYCDFNSHVTKSVDHEAWKLAFRAEIRRYASEFPGRKLRSIFFGGGTPSLMDPSTVEDIIGEAQKAWQFSNDIEITLEANPTSVEAARFRDFRLAGVNRVSVGVQALNDPDLRKLGRLHSVAEALAAVNVAAREFDRTSFDLIYSRQDQTLDGWQAELTQAIDFAGEHLSLYQLTVEPETVFGHRHELGQLKGLPDEDLQADMYHLTQEMCGSAGMPAYEVSNHAKPGAESRHNVVYWNGGDWVGIGPGAHGRLTKEGARFGTTSVKSPAFWLKSAGDHVLAHETREKLTPHDAAVEYLMMSLRLNTGCALGRVSVLNLDLDHVKELGFVYVADNHLRLTEAGRPLLNAILREILVT